MDMISRKELGLLVQKGKGPHVSIYISTERTGDTEQDRIKLKNGITEAEAKLIENGLRATLSKQMLQPARQLLDDPFFWSQRADGLSFFISEGLFRYYRLPRNFNNVVVVGERFHVKPLLTLFSDGLFYILAVSQQRIRLLQCNEYSCINVTPAEVPANIAQTLQYDEFEKQYQYHTVGPGSLITHGQGAGKDIEKVNILRYFQQIDRAMHPLLKEQAAPMVMVAVEYQHSIYREANTYQHLLIDEIINRNPDDLSEKQLHQQVLALMIPYFQKSRQQSISQYNEFRGQGRTLKSLREIVLASYDGMVAVLFVAINQEAWGLFDSELRRVTFSADRNAQSEDLLDFAAVNTLINGGTVYALERDQVPGGSSVAAILRYPITPEQYVP